MVKKLKAATLVEVIIAMVVVVIVFVFATGIYSNILKSSPTIKQQRIHQTITKIISESIESQNWEDGNMEFDGLIFRKVVKPYQDYTTLINFQVTALDQGKEVAQVNQIVKIKRDETEE